MHSKSMSVFSIGVDEVGRGAWAWPVVASACALTSKEYSFSSLLDDSKKLTALKREEVFTLIEEYAKLGKCFFGVGIMSSEIIDAVGIREANRLAMEEALRQVMEQLELRNKINKKTRFPKIQIDGRDNYSFSGIEAKDIEYIVRGDGYIPTIQAASIIAKVSRDRLMKKLGGDYWVYWFGSHKWYGTLLHETNLAIHGPSDVHRKSFAPIKKLILGGNYV